MWRGGWRETVGRGGGVGWWEWKGGGLLLWMGTGALPYVGAWGFCDQQGWVVGAWAVPLLALVQQRGLKNTCLRFRRLSPAHLYMLLAGLFLSGTAHPS